MSSAVLLVAIGRMVAAGICAAGAGVLAFNGKPGWGWFLFAAVWLGAITVSSKSDGSAEVSE